MNNKTKRIVALILVIVLLLTSLSGGIILAVKNSVMLKPQESSESIKELTFSVVDRVEDETDPTTMFFGENGEFVWEDKANNTNKKGSYKLYTGTDIARMYNENKEDKNMSRSDIKNVSEAVNSFVDEGIVKNKNDVVYIKVTNVKITKDNQENESNDLLFFGTKTENGGYSLKETTTSSYYSLTLL